MDKKATIYAALLRGINVGGHRRVPMAELRELLEGLGLVGVKTYLQSGNAVFQAPDQDPSKLASKIEGALEKHFGFEVAVTTRSGTELARVESTSPIRGKGDHKTQNVAFLDAEPAEEVALSGIAALESRLLPSEEIHLIGRELHLLLPTGVGKSKVTTNEIEKRLDCVATVRNWRTLENLIGMTTPG